MTIKIVYGSGNHYSVIFKNGRYECNGLIFGQSQEQLEAAKAYCDKLNKSVTKSIELDRKMGRKYND